MSRIALTPQPRVRVVALISVAVSVAVAVGLVGARGSRADATEGDGIVPTATVTSRTMAVTSQVDGTVQRAARYEVRFGDSWVASSSDVPDVSAGGSSGAASTVGVGAATTASAATLTSIAVLGTPVATGTVLYAASGEPFVAVLAGSAPIDGVFWRDLTTGVDDGADVRVLEEALATLGYGDDLTVDETFTSVTAAAVERWEIDLGRLEPDGVVALGDLVVVPEPGEVVSRLVQPGVALRTGSAVLTIASTTRVVGAAVEAARIAEWPAGASVTLAWSDGRSTAAHVVATARDVVDGVVDLVIDLDAQAPGRATGTPVTVVRTAEQRDGALTVPVAAIVEGEAGRPSVVALDGAVRRRVHVTVGVVSGGWVEVSGDLVAGEHVVLPG